MRRVWVATLLIGCGRFGFADMEPRADAVVCSLAFDGTPGRVNFSSSRELSAVGGREPVRYSIDNPALAAIDPDRGTVSAFAQPGTITVTATDADNCTVDTVIAIGGDSIYYAGGSSMSVPRAEVYRSTDGTTWTQVGMLPAARSAGVLVTFRNRLWWISGSDGGAASPDIYSSANGTDWSIAGALPAAARASSFALTVFEDELWIVGGNQNGTSLTSVYRSDDALAWTKVGDLPMGNHGGSLAVLGGQLVYSGGHNSALYDWVLTSPTGANWTQVGTLAIAREYHSTTVVDGRMYVVGGQNTTPASLPSVASTTDGSSWTVEPALPVGRAFGPLVRFNDMLWSFGGTDMGGVFRGAPSGSWTTMPSTFPFPRQAGGAALFTPAN